MERNLNNVSRAQQILQWFESLGVSDICICPGGRNAPFVFALENSKRFQITSAFDERAAGFFAYGRSYAQQKPAVVVTTSGTAAAELLPSVVEAHYSQAPLIVLTCDRPQHLRGTGSPQVIDQLNIFGAYVEQCVDMDWNSAWQAPVWTQSKPLHINISFEEPLLDGNLESWPSVPCDEPQRAPNSKSAPMNDSSSEKLAQHIQSFTERPGVPLLIVGPLHPREVQTVRRLCQSWTGVQYVEAASGLREEKLPGQLLAGEKFISKLLKESKLSGVLRVGGVPTLKLWRELENSNVPVVSVSSRPFAGLARGAFLHFDFEHWTPAPFDLKVDQALKASLLREGEGLFQKQQELLAKYPESEPAWVHALSKKIPSTDKIYIGNSLPIRQWDAFARYDHNQHLAVNRGANGIDGQIASAIGMATKSDSLSIVIGDLTALYDATGFWFKDSVKNLRVFVINNNGGRIFERLFQQKAFYNSHSVRFEGLATMWNLPYQQLKLNDTTTGQGLFEIVPDAGETQKFWDEYERLAR